jgi:L-asparaginase II
MALKIDDGARRGAESTAAHVIAALFAGELEGAGDLYDLKLTNWRGRHVGEIVPSEELVGAVERLRS